MSYSKTGSIFGSSHEDDEDNDIIEERPQDGNQPKDDIVKKYNILIRKIIFKASDMENIYVIVYKKCYEYFYIYKIKFGDLVDRYTFSHDKLYC